MGETREQYYGVKGEPFGRDHLVLARSASTLCGKTIGANWLMARGIFTAKSFIGSPGACEACSNAVRPPARETLDVERIRVLLPGLAERFERAIVDDHGERLAAFAQALRSIADMVDRPPARDGATLSDEREARLRFLQAEFATSIPSGKYFDADEMLVLRDDIDALMDTVAALRAELADARADTERLDWLEKWLPEQPGHRRLVFDRSVPEFTLFQSDDNVRRLGMKKKLRTAIDAARAASGEDASRHE